MPTERKLKLHEVEALGNEIALGYGNEIFRKWYYKVIFELGEIRTLEIRAMAADAKFPAKVFSRRAKEEMEAKRNREQLEKINDLKANL